MFQFSLFFARRKTEVISAANSAGAWHVLRLKRLTEVFCTRPALVQANQQHADGGHQNQPENDDDPFHCRLQFFS